MPTSSVARRPRLPSFSLQIVLALVLGLGLGWAALTLGPTADGGDNGLTVLLDTVGSTFVTLLKALVPPLVVTAIIASIANLRGVADAARLAGKTLLWFAITALASVLVGVGLGVLIQPGRHTTIARTAAQATSTHGGWLDFVDQLVPTNVLGLAVTIHEVDGALQSSVSFKALQLVVVALVVGIAAVKVGDAAEPFLRFNASVLAIVQKVLWWVILLAPLGTIGLVGRAVATYGWSSLGQLGAFALAIYAGLAIVLLALYPAILLAHGLSPRSYFRGAWPAIQLGFVSRSSLGTLPMTQQVTERLGVPREYAAFASPLAATTKMDGCAAIYPAVAAIFVAQFFGVPLSPLDYLLVVVVSVIGSAATAGLTGAIVMLTLTLSTLGLPLAGVGLLLAIDPILDMGRTAVNVAGQVLVQVVVARREGLLDQAAYDAPRATVPVSEVGSDTREPALA
ncbi:dicarboxylate/amino acid:cation symporter [Arsenicicoccus dermatophilus]|uniref:dicarboxylate/amino acid:cation symporter n=1 Tax=Arsenicicoccus dermatophilus TaxID=1076331 RepID=UPI001F4D0A35|nr:dicarboxylate/amino acid:cation symporter [Arsenicicoccus dermatophilus]MCH8614020.1 dicarboxylate/amino acid:cation symporter [Arsenicicoccus dermatophilus]